MEEDWQKVVDWAAACKLSPCTIDTLKKEGYSCMEALEFLDDEALRSSERLSKLPVGQRRLLMHAASKMQAANKSTEQTVSSGPTETVPVGGVPVGGPGQQTEGGPSESLVEVLLGHLKGKESGATTSGQPVLGSTGPQMSWQDPQVYLQAATARGGRKFHDIVDFVGGHWASQEQVLVDTADGPQLVIKSGPAKPKLESLNVHQWAVASICIFDKLVQEGAISSMQDVLDYQSYTIRIHQLCSKFTIQSVLCYDREYRKLQNSLKFRWGTDVGHHLQAVTLIPKSSVGATKVSGGNTRGSRTDHRGPVTAQGRTICISYNTAQGCRFVGCKFAHVCSVNGCSKDHPACKHDIVSGGTKNAQGGPTQSRS